MAVVGESAELPDSPIGDFTLGKHTITRKFKVVTNNINDGPLIVIAAIGVPRLYEAYVTPNEFHLYCLCREVSAERVGPGNLNWIVTAKYETPDLKEGSNNNTASGGSHKETAGEQNNPLLMIPECSITGERYEEVIYGVYDLDSGTFKPCMASNNEVFDPPPTKDSSRLILSITRNESMLTDLGTLLSYTDVVNSDVFWGFAAGTWKMNAPSITKQVKQLSNGSQFEYLKVVYTFHGKSLPRGWDTWVLDSGTFYFESMTGKKRKFLTDDGHPCQGALDGSGGKLGVGSPPVFIINRPYPRLPFSVLALPQTFSTVS